jgi:hypothetical protein
MEYYRTLAVIFVILILSVIVQGKELFSDVFFAIAYVIMGLVLFIGTKFERSPKIAMLVGLVLIFSVGFLSTSVIIDFFTKPPSVTVFFKLMIVFSLDACALFFLHYGRRMKAEEMKDHALGQCRIAAQER